MDEYSESIGIRLKSVREALSLNQRAFSDLLGIANQQSLSKYERGIQDIPDRIKVRLRQNGVSLDWLLTGEGEMFLPGRAPRPEGAPENALPEAGSADTSTVKGPGGLVLKQGTKAFPRARDADLTDGALFPKTSRYLAARAGVPVLTMKPVEPERGGIVVARGTQFIRVEEDSSDDIFLVPFVEQRVSAGPGQEPTQVCETRRAPVPRRIAEPYNPDEILSAEVRGDSMTGVSLYDGDIVFFVRTDHLADGIHVLTIAGETFVKRLEYNPFEEQLTVLSENERYRPIVLTKDKLENVRIEGKVIGWVHRHPY